MVKRAVFILYVLHVLWLQAATSTAFAEERPAAPTSAERAAAKATDVVLPPPLAPDEALKTIHVREGFVVELMAAEPLTMDPVAFAWGADGKLWVVEMGDYPSGLDAKGKPGGVVRFLEDENGDGRYDKSTVFLDALGFPTGIAPWRNGVLVTCAPDIFYAEDRDGDGRADHRETLFTGFGEGNQQHRVNGLKWGLDGWLYCANGDSGGAITATRSGAKVNVSGRDLRIRPDAGLLDPQSGLSQYGRNRDDWGNWFGCSNSKPMYHFVLEDHYLRRNAQLASGDVRLEVPAVPGAAPVFPRSRTLARFNDLNAANRFTSANSSMVYRDDLLGPEFQNNWFTSEPVHNLVHREVMQAEGLTFRSHRAAGEEQSEFLASSDNWFRPTMLQTGPDGALWIADMYRLVIEHPQWIPAQWQQRLDLRAGADKGRIYRVYPAGKQPRDVPKLTEKTNAELVAALDSPSGWQRDMVQQLLLWREARDVGQALSQLVLQSARPECRAQALCTLDLLEQLSEPVLIAALADKHGGVRRQAVRISESWVSGSPQVAAAVLKLASDTSGPVRLQLAYTLGAARGSEAAATLAALARQHADDRWLTTALLSSISRDNVSEVLGAVLGEQNSPPPAQFVEQLVSMAVAWDVSPALVRSIEALTGRPEQPLASWQQQALAQLLAALAKKKPAGSASAGSGATAGLSSSAASRIAARTQAARATVSDSARSDDERIPALGLLGYEPVLAAEDTQRVAALIDPRASGALQSAAFEVLARTAGDDLPNQLLRGWKSYGPALRVQALDLLLSRDAWTAVLLDRVAQGPLAVADLDAARRQRLVTHKNLQLRERATKLLSTATSASRQAVLEQFAAVLAMTGDAAAGNKVFAKRCANCHALSGVGHAVGPDLAALTDNSPQFLLTAMLDPNRAVETKFLDYLAIDDSGRTFTGMLASESGTSITLVGPEAKQRIILRAELETLQSTGRSLMPEGLEKDLAARDFADVIAYLRSHTPRKVFKGNQPLVILPTSDGSLRLAAPQAEIYGPTLVFESKYKNLGYWSGASDRAQWTIDVAHAGRYRVRMHYACQNSAAGNRFRLQLATAVVPCTVQGTGTWDDYDEVELGEIELPAGKLPVSVQAEAPLRGALMDLGLIELLPVK